MSDDKIIDFEPRRTKDEVFKGKFGLIKDIAISSAMMQLQDVKTFQAGAIIGLYQGLKYRGNFGQGMKAGLATVGVITGLNVVTNLIKNVDEIKKA